MTANFIGVRRALQAFAAASVVVACAGTAQAQVQAPVKLAAQYTISVARIPIGEATSALDIGAEQYTATAKGHASGVLRVLASGEGTFEAHGIVKDGVPEPTAFSAKTASEDDNADIKMTLDAGTVNEVHATAPPAAEDRVPLADANRQGVIDPLSALLVPVSGTGDAVSADACKHTLPVFDGRRRFDLALSFRRMDKVKADKGYQGPVVVCAVTFQAIAGYRTGSPLIKYLSGGRDIEFWLAPVAGTRLLAPFRLAVASMLGNLVVDARQFEVTSISPARAAMENTAAN